MSNSSVVTYYPGYSQRQVAENYIVRTISDITNAYPMVVTTINDHGYSAGLKVRFLIPINFGMVELNNLDGQITAVTSDTMTVDIDSTNFTPFVVPSPLPEAYTPPSVIPNSSGPYIPPAPLPYGNQDSFKGAIYNNGAV